MTWSNIRVTILALFFVLSGVLGAVSGCNQSGSKKTQVMVPVTTAEAPDCKLYLIKHGTSHQALICVGGWQSNEWLTIERARLAFDMALSNFATIDANQSIPLWDEISVCMLAYDTSKGADDLARQFMLLMSKDKFLSDVGIRYVWLAHSYGGLIGNEVDLLDSRQLGSLNAGSSWNGTWLVDKEAVDKAVKDIYTDIGESIISWSQNSKVDFGTESIKWMLPDSTRRKNSLARSDFANKFFYVGEFPPAGMNAWFRNVNLAGLFDSFLWQDVEMQNKQAYALGARLIMQISDEPSDGVVAMSSASADGYPVGNRVRLVGERNHSQVITGNQGDELLHRMMYADMMYLFLSDPKRNMPKFDVLLPQMPTVDIPVGMVQRTEHSQMVFIHNDEICLADANGDDEVTFSFKGLKCSYPDFLDDRTLLFTGQSGNQYDIYTVGDGVQVMRLTYNGDSQMAVPTRFGMVVWSDKKLIYRSLGGATHTLVEDNVALTSPPIVLGEDVYFTHQSGAGKPALYLVGLRDAHRRLSDLEVIANTVHKPIRLGNAILTVDIEGKDAKLSVVVGSMNHNLDLATKYLNQHNLQTLESIQVNSKFTHLYVSMDGEIRIIAMSDFLIAVGAQSDWTKWMQTQTVTVPEIKKLIPVKLQGSQLNLK